MKILTKYFGEQEIDDKSIIEFKHPLYGFDEYRQFTVLTDSDMGHNLVWLQSTQTSDICFLIANGKAFDETYQIAANTEQLQLVAAKDAKDVDYFNIVVMGETFDQSTMNLKSPIIINPDNNQAAQIILDGEYPFKYRMFEAC